MRTVQAFLAWVCVMVVWAVIIIIRNLFGKQK